MSQLRDTIGYILNDNIIYSKQYEKIEYGKAGEQLEKLLDSEMGKFSEWLDTQQWIYFVNKKTWTHLGTQEDLTTPQLIELYKSRNKV